MGALRRGAGTVGPRLLWTLGAGATLDLREGRPGAGEATGKIPCVSPLAPRAAGFPNSLALAVESAFGAGTRQATSRQRARTGGTENPQELGSFAPRSRLIPLQTWSCLLPRPPQGGGGDCCSLPLPRPCRRRAPPSCEMPLRTARRGWGGGEGAGVCAPTRGWPERGSEGRKLGKQSPRSESGKGNASAGGEGREGRACQPGWRAGRRGAGGNRPGRAGRRRERRRRGPVHRAPGGTCLHSSAQTVYYLLRWRLVQPAWRGAEGRARFLSPTHLGLARRPRLLLSSTGWTRLPFFPLFGCGLDDILPSSAYREAGLEFKLLGFFFPRREEGGFLRLTRGARSRPRLGLVGLVARPPPAERARRGKSSLVPRLPPSLLSALRTCVRPA